MPLARAPVVPILEQLFKYQPVPALPQPQHRSDRTIAAPPRSQAATCTVLSVDEERLALAKAAELPAAVVRDVADVFKILGDPTRLSILRALGSGELCVCELSEVLDLSVSAVSHQLRKLRDRGVVACRMDGRFAHYRVADPFVASVLTSCIDRVTVGMAT